MGFWPGIGRHQIYQTARTGAHGRPGRELMRRTSRCRFNVPLRPLALLCAVATPPTLPGGLRILPRKDPRIAIRISPCDPKTGFCRMRRGTLHYRTVQ